MLTIIMPIFAHKHITNNRIESKNSQIKRCGGSRKQPSSEYSDNLVQLSEYISQHQRLPEVTLKGRPLFKYLMQKQNMVDFGYKIKENGKNTIQKVISSYI